MSESTPLPKARPARLLPQVRLRTLLLLTAAVAVWIADAKNRHDNDRFAEQIEAMRPIARELMVEDPAEIAVVKQEERWYDQNDWKVYLPEGNYHLCVATREVAEQDLAPVTKSVPIAAGTRHIAIEQQRDPEKNWLVVITVDGREALRVEEPADWDAGRGSSGGGQFSNSTQLPPEEPVVLFRRRFTVETSSGSYSTPKGPSNGVLLWIEQAGLPKRPSKPPAKGD